MAIDIGSWLSSGGGGPAAQEATRAALAYKRILDKKTDVAFRTPSGTILAAQPVRIESDSSASATMSTAGKSAARRVVVFGIRNHSSVANTDIQVGYRFVLNAEELRCVDVILTLGELQAIFEATG
jgi:hypothetical protein